MVDEDEIALVHHAESAAERVDPEAVGLDRVAKGDVPGDALVVTVFPEDAERGCEAAFEVFTLFIFVGEGWRSRIVSDWTRVAIKNDSLLGERDHLALSNVLLNTGLEWRLAWIDGQFMAVRCHACSVVFCVWCHLRYNTV